MASFIGRALQTEGFVVDAVHNGEETLAVALTTPYDAIVLDIMLPGRDGLSVLRELGANRNHVSVLLLPARDHVNDCSS